MKKKEKDFFQECLDEVKINEFEIIFIADVQLKKDDIVIVPCGYDIERIVQVINIQEWKKRNLARLKRAKLMSVMNEKKDDIKAREALEKYAGKDKDFKDLLKEYDEMFGVEFPKEVESE